VRARRVSPEIGRCGTQGDLHRDRIGGRDRAWRAERLEEQGIGADVVSMPCTERFDAQPDDYREHVLPDVSNREILRVSVEAGTTFGWERYTGLHGLRIGIDRYGVSSPAKDAFEFFGLTPDAVARRVLERLGK
jgi:transketolase